MGRKHQREILTKQSPVYSWAALRNNIGSPAAGLSCPVNVTSREPSLQAKELALDFSAKTVKQKGWCEPQVLTLAEEEGLIL